MQRLPSPPDSARAEGTVGHDRFLSRVHKELEGRVREDHYRAWFRNISLLSLQAEEAEFGVPSGFVRDWLSRNYIRVLEDAVASATEGNRLQVKLSLDAAAAPGARVDDQHHSGLRLGDDHGAAERDAGAARAPHGDVAGGRSAGAKAGFGMASDDPLEVIRGEGVPGGCVKGPSSELSGSRASTSAVGEDTGAVGPEGVEAARPLGVDEDEFDAVIEGSGLNKDYTFERFVVGDCNRLSHAAALAIGEHPGCAYNPLFIHGNAGLGKTHLLQATCRSILQKRRGARVSYLSCEDFTNRYIRAIQDGTLDDFRQTQRGVDVLVIDDVQFLANKERTQEEFFHTFNELFNKQCQIVISSDRSPQEIPMIEDRLVSRFKWGLVAEMEAPSHETRVAIAKRKSAAMGHEMPEDVAVYIADRIDKNIRELEGAVVKVVCVMRLCGRELTPDLAAEAMRGVYQRRSAPLTSEGIMSMIAEEYSVSQRDIIGKGRTQTISLPRQIGMYLTRTLTKLSLEEIGRHYGNRDHTTVLYAVQKMEKRIKEDRRFRETVETLRSRLQR